MLKTIMLAAVSASALALVATEASAQATPVFGSPAQATTSEAAPASKAANRAAIRVRHLDTYAAASFEAFQQPNANNKHTVHIREY